jgi:hypothetical protein
MQEPKITEEYVDFEGDSAERPFIKAAKTFFFGPYFVILCLILTGVICFSLGYYAREVGGEHEVKFLNAVSEVNGEVKGVSTSTNLTDSPQASSPQRGAGASPSTSSGQAPLGKEGQVPLVKPGQVVASKNGTKYHLPTCPGAKQISDKNKITFNSAEEARAAGYSPASNCKGLK